MCLLTTYKDAEKACHVLIICLGVRNCSFTHSAAATSDRNGNLETEMVMGNVSVIELANFIWCVYCSTAYLV